MSRVRSPSPAPTFNSMLVSGFSRTLRQTCHPTDTSGRGSCRSVQHDQRCTRLHFPAFHTAFPGHATCPVWLVGFAMHVRPEGVYAAHIRAGFDHSAVVWSAVDRVGSHVLGSGDAGDRRVAITRGPRP